jgi:hypothetical protein
MTPEQRTHRARTAANASWANTEDRAARTAKARQAAAARFEKQARRIKPNAPDEDIARLAEQLKKDFHHRRCQASAQARRAPDKRAA